MKLINNNDLSEKVLRINNGELTCKSISKINILATKKKGYARQMDNPVIILQLSLVVMFLLYLTDRLPI